MIQLRLWIMLGLYTTTLGVSGITNTDAGLNKNNLNYNLMPKICTQQAFEIVKDIKKEEDDRATIEIVENIETIEIEDSIIPTNSKPKEQQANVIIGDTKEEDSTYIAEDNLTGYTDLNIKSKFYTAKISKERNKLYLDYTGTDGKGIVVINNKNVYKVADEEIIALTDGDGKYFVQLLTEISGNQSKYWGDFTVDAINTNDKSAYLGNSYYSDYNKNNEQFNSIVNSISNKSNTLDAYILGCYKYVAGFKYDTAKSNLIMAGDILRYKPNIEELVKSNEGICLDKAALMASLLRAVNIPSKVVFGYYGSVYHAWVDVYTGSEWKLFDPTFEIDYTSKEAKSYRVTRYN